MVAHTPHPFTINYINIQKQFNFHTKINSTKIKKIVKNKTWEKVKLENGVKTSLERGMRLKFFFGLVSIKFDLIQLEIWHW